MIDVPPPEGVSPEELERLLGVSESAATSQGEFDDIESILATTPQSIRPTLAAARQHPASPAGQVSSPTGSQPILPSDQWTSTTAQNRRRWVVAITAAVAVIATVTVVIAAIIANRQRPADHGTQLADQNIKSSTTAEPMKDATGGTGNQPATDSNPATDGSALADNADGDDLESNTDTGDSNQPSNPNLPPNSGGNMETDRDQAVSKPGSGESTERSSSDDGDDRPTALTTEPAATQPTTDSDQDSTDSAQNDRNRPRGLDSLLDPAQRIDGPDNSSDRLTELDELLAGSGTSLSEIRTTAATFRAIENVGLPKYFFEKADPLEPAILENLEWDCMGVFFDSKPLQFALNDVTRVTGVPIQWDVASLRATNLNLLEPITVKETELPFRELLSRILEPRGLALHLQADQLPRIHSATAEELVEASYELPGIQGDDAEAKLGAFVHSIRVLIAPESWQREESPATIERNGRKLTVLQTPANHREIARYIQRIENGRRGVAGLPMDPELSKARWIHVEDRLQTAFSINSPLPLTLSDLINRFSQQTELGMIIDWDAALPMGWTPNATVPGYIVEDTSRQALTQICRSLEMTWRVVNDRTIQLTSYERAAQDIELDVYPVHKILAGRLTDQALMLALEESLSLRFNRSPQLQVLYEPECQCVIVLAPQYVHRQIHAVLQRLGAGLQETARRAP